VTFRTRFFLASLAATIVTVVVATSLLSWSIRRDVTARIEGALVAEARMAAELLSERRAAAAAQLDVEADALGALGSARVTFLARDGRVIGDSDVAAADLPSLENHGDRPEVQQAAQQGIGIARRYSETLGLEMLYVAVPVRNPDIPELAWLRLAMPLTAVREQLAAVRNVALAALIVGLVAAAALAWTTSQVLATRLRTMADAARRYAAGDFTRPTRDAARDEIGTIARVLDESVRELGRRAADRALLEAILGGMIEGVLVVDQYGKLQLVNAAARRMLKVVDPPEGRHYLEIVRHPDIAAQLGYALDGRPTEGRELKLPQAPGATFIGRTASVATSDHRGAVLVLHDITDLRKADQVRRDFVANVSHELRTPLTAVRGYVEALSDGVADPEESRRFLETIARHTLRMERLVHDLLRLARLDAGQEVIERLPCSIESVFTAVEMDLHELIESRRQRVVRSIAPDAATVPGDPAKLHDALRNLLENATNYAPEGTTITLGARRDGTRILLTVQDEGPGIPDADLSRVFERFYRVDKARARSSRDPGGTGLGLAIVKHLIELHGGHVTAANAHPKGAVFTVTLPL
jgi:two-component system phosphate regulon sensor histidine kinase PhoR